MVVYHDIFLVGINILHTSWHISQRCISSRVSIFFRISSEYLYVYGRYHNQIFQFSEFDCLLPWLYSLWYLLSFLHMFHSQKIPIEVPPVTCQSPHIQYEDILCWFHVVWPMPCCIIIEEDPFPLIMLPKIEQWSMLPKTIRHDFIILNTSIHTSIFL